MESSPAAIPPERGRSYAEGGAVFDTRRQGPTLKARCEGSLPEAYRVSATLDDGGTVKVAW